MKQNNFHEIQQTKSTLLRRFGEDSIRQASIRSFELAAYGEQEDAEFWALIEAELRVDISLIPASNIATQSVH